MKEKIKEVIRKILEARGKNVAQSGVLGENSDGKNIENLSSANAAILGAISGIKGNMDGENLLNTNENFNVASANYNAGNANSSEIGAGSQKPDVKKIIQNILSARSNGQNSVNSGSKAENEIIDEVKINNLILNILAKNKLLEKLNIPIDSGFQQAQNSPEKINEIKSQIKKLCDFGLISKTLGDSIGQKFGVSSESEMPETTDTIDFDSFDGELGDFFKKRENLQNYLKNSGTQMDTQKLEKIVELVKTLENKALEEYKQAIFEERKKNLKAPDSLASSTTGTPLNPQKGFSAREIANMSTDDFLKNEKLINSLLSKGLIK